MNVARDKVDEVEKRYGEGPDYHAYFPGEVK
jgi:hypothetical protein